jgi:glycosyltransferase involved in cell wall biosynthesis
MISVIVCTYNRASSLAAMLQSLAQMSVPSDLDWELIVVDNNSLDKTLAVVVEFQRLSGLNVRYLFEPKQGLCHARNRGIAESAGEIIAFTDDDVRVATDWLQELVGTFREFDCMGVGGKSIPAWNGLAKPTWLVTNGPYCLSRGPLLDFDLGSEAKEIQYPPWGVNMAFRKAAFEKCGGFRTDLGVSGSGGMLGEDVEFGKRLLNSGEKIAYSPGAVVFHPVEPHRATREYFLQYYFKVGKTEIRLEGWPQGAALYFGIPRYMFRTLLERCKTWLFTVAAEERFYRKARVYSLVGQMCEAYASKKKKENLAGLRGSQRAY